MNTAGRKPELRFFANMGNDIEKKSFATSGAHRLTDVTPQIPNARDWMKYPERAGKLDLTPKFKASWDIASVGSLGTTDGAEEPRHASKTQPACARRNSARTYI